VNIALFFEGTGHGVHGKRTNVSLVYEACAREGQALHFEPGPGTHFGYFLSGRAAGHDWRKIFASACRWFEANDKSKARIEVEERKDNSARQLSTSEVLAKPRPSGEARTPPLRRCVSAERSELREAKWLQRCVSPHRDGGFASSSSTKIFLFGFSRGALLARHFAAWLNGKGIPVEYLGLWDTVDAIPDLEVSETCPPNVAFARHAVAENESRRFYDYVPLREQKVEKTGGGGQWTDQSSIVNLNLQPQEALAKARPSGEARTPPLRRCGVSPHYDEGFASSSVVNLNLQPQPSHQVEERLFPGVHSDVGGLYADNHEFADAARAWVAQGAAERGLLFAPGSFPESPVCLSETAIRHDETRHFSNLFGLLRPVQRVFPATLRRISDDGVRAIVSLGSNIEPRREYLKRAIDALSTLPETRLVRASSVFETEPVDVPPEFAERRFLNQAVVFETKLSAPEFSRRMHAIEDDLGRVRTVRNGPRTIDIDLIDFGGLVLDTPELTLPHPRAHLRDFVLKPLEEIGIEKEELAKPPSR